MEEGRETLFRFETLRIPSFATSHTLQYADCSFVASARCSSAFRRTYGAKDRNTGKLLLHSRVLYYLTVSFCVLVYIPRISGSHNSDAVALTHPTKIAHELCDHDVWEHFSPDLSECGLRNSVRTLNGLRRQT